MRVEPYETLPEFHYNRDAVNEGGPNPLDRFTYGLTFAHAPRPISAASIDGPDIPNAYNLAETGAGDWHSDIDDAGHDALRHVVKCAVNEAVHEALEWIRLDGEMLLNPHGTHEMAIFEAVETCIEGLLPLAVAAYRSRGSDKGGERA